MDIRPFREDDRPAVIDLWRRCDLVRPWNDPDHDIDRKLGRDSEGFLVGEVEGEVVASVMVGYEGHRGWVNYLAVDPDRWGSGWGRQLMDEAERQLVGLGCPKLNLQVRATNTDAVEFYRLLGYRIDDVVSMGKRLIADD